MTSPETKLENLDNPDLDDQSPEVASLERFPPEEEATLLAASNTQKAHANTLYTTSYYSEAISTYSSALASLPNYLDYEIAVLKSNISACHLKLEDWKATIEAATGALDALDRVTPKNKKKTTKEGDDGKQNGAGEEADGEGGVVEIQGEGEEAEEELRALQISDEKREAVRRIRGKALMRRAKGKEGEGGWGNLAAAETDYKDLSQIPNLPSQDMKLVREALASLPARINQAKEREMGEMMGKLKELGNGILKPFGLSTDMFKMNQDPVTGGYNMQFNQGG